MKRRAETATTMKLDTRTFPDSDGLSRGALEELLRVLEDAVAERGRFAVALSGGRTPAKLYALGAQQRYRAPTPWARVHLLWGVERRVPRTIRKVNTE